MASSWMKDLQDRMKRASSDMNVALQPKVQQAKRTLEQSIQQIGLRPGPEIYQDDLRLHHALAQLDALRDTLQALSLAVDQHRTRLLALATSQSALASILSDPPDALAPLLRKQLPPARLAVQEALSGAQTVAAAGTSRFAMDMSTPMVDLARTFEEAFGAKVVPLRKRYVAQKTEFLRYIRQAAATDDPARKDSLGAMAQSAEPLWRATSDTLMAEIQSLVSYTVSHINEWTLNVAQAQAESLARAAKAFEQPAADAERAQNLPEG